MGLLLDDPQQMGLLSLGLRLMSTPGNFGEALGRAGLGSLGDYQQAQTMAEQRKLRAQQAEMAQMQMEDAKRARERVAGIENAYAGAFRSPEQQAMAQYGGPTIAAAQAAPTMQPKIDQDALLQSLMKVDPVSAYQMMQPKPSDYKVVDGSLVEIGPRGVREAYRAPKDPKEDSRIQALKLIYGEGTPQYLRALQNLGAAIAPDPAPVGGSGGAGSIDAGGAAQASLVKQFGKPPKDHRWKPDGSAEPIPGGPADIKAGEIGAKTAAKKDAQAAQAQTVLDTLADAKKLVGYTTAGAGGLLASVPMTDARNLQAKLETVKANLGFDRLQQMRDQSPTGGALGAVAVQELTALQSTVASLDQLQSPSQLRAALEKIERHYRKWLTTISEGGASGDWGAGPAPAKPATPGVSNW